ncbi:MAG: tetratricopeptide repeat protein, partial [Chromatiaceae bacterium]|nr:tetratricopeptide repeat protein [Chromatiaceae bacterium]
MAQTLIVSHTEEHRFRVLRPDGKRSEAVVLTPPDGVAVEGRPNSHLLQDLGWYLEQFLDYPFPPNTEIAERIQKALRGWGEESFERLFTGQPLLWYERAYREGLEHLTVKIASDDPRVLSWPWEALRDPDGTTLAHSCRIERQLGALHDPLALPEQLPANHINILLIIARPYGAEDVGYHALARPLVEQVQAKRLPVRIDVLRPPTFAQLQAHLRQRPGFYHIVHFDGHGGYGQGAYSGSPHSYRGIEGRLIFETEAGKEDPIGADKLTALLGEHRIPIMVLNACQSARIDERAEDPFASVAAALLKTGIRAVVAMGYNLYVSGAQQFVPAFYTRLLESGEVAEASRAGRQAMRLRDERVCARGVHPLQDWLVPVLYQQEALVLPVDALEAVPAANDLLPAETQVLGDYGFIGRQRAIQALERAFLHQPQAAVLIHGMAGVGKSTLAKGYLHWLQQTNGFARAADGGLFATVLWLSFEDIRSAEFVVNALIEPLFGHAATAAPLEQKLPALTKALRETPMLIVWDNFESAAGITGTEVTPLLPEEDRQQLKTLIKDLRGGRSKLLITSRAPESWLAPTEVYRLPLGGLQGEERWEYCNAVVADLGLHPDRTDTHYSALMDALDGHPLAMRAVLLRLGEVPAEQLLTELEQAFAGAEGDESTRGIFAALELLDRGLPATFAPVLPLIGLHRRYVDIDYLEQMAKLGGTPTERQTLNQCFAALQAGGLLHAEGQGIYRMHPALGGFLAARHPAAAVAQRGFVDFMGRLADQLASKELHEQRGPFAIHGASFHQALAQAARSGMDAHVAALTQSLAAFALNRRDFAAARQLFEAYATNRADTDDQEGLAGAYHQLGRIAEEQRDFASAEAWYKKSLAIVEKQGNEHGAAITYHQLGMIAEEQRDFASAEAWYKKSLAIKEKQGNEHGAAGTYHQLGRIAEEQRDFAAAGASLLKSVVLFARFSDQ